MTDISASQITAPAIDHDATYAPVKTSRWKGDYERWPICDDINDPRLGLTYEQLTTSLQPLGLPAGWNETMAAELAAATWLMLSRRAGLTQGLRGTLAAWQTAAMAIAMTDVTAVGTPFADFAIKHDRVRCEGHAGVAFGAQRATWRRLVAASPFRHVHGQRRMTRWAVGSVTDSVALDGAWEQAEVNAHPPAGLLPVLDVRALSAMFPARRLVVVGASGISVDQPPQAGDVVLRVPSFWEITAVVLGRGPEEFMRRATQWLSTSSARPLPARGARAAGRTMARDSLQKLASDANGFTKTAKEVHTFLDVLSPWAVRRPLAVSRAQRQRASVPEPCIAPSLARFRFYAAHARKQAEVTRQSRRPRSAWSRTRHAGWLKTLLLLELGVATSARVNEVVSLRLDAYDPHHDFAAHGEGPALLIKPSKVDDRIPAFWHPIAPKTAIVLDEWIERWEISDRASPLFPFSGDRRHEPLDPADVSNWFQGSDRKPSLPIDGQRLGHGINDVRHLACQLLTGIGEACLKDNPSYQDKIDSSAFADMLLGHLAPERYAYLDMAGNRQIWAYRGALGERNSPGLLDIALGDAGARRSWNHSAIRAALSRIEHASTELASARRDYGEAERSITRATAELRRRPSVDDVADRRIPRYIAEGDAIRDVREEQRENRRRAELAAASAEHTISDAKRELELIEARGKTRLVPDSTPLDQRADECETFHDALTRVRETIASVDVDRLLGQHPDGETALRLRDVMNLSEFAALYGVRARTVERWVSGQRRAPVRLDEAIVRVNARTTLIDLHVLPESWWTTLTICQREQVEQLLRIPLGDTRYGGAGSSSVLTLAPGSRGG